MARMPKGSSAWELKNSVIVVSVTPSDGWASGSFWRRNLTCTRLPRVYRAPTTLNSPSVPPGRCRRPAGLPSGPRRGSVGVFFDVHAAVDAGGDGLVGLRVDGFVAGGFPSGWGGPRTVVEPSGIVDQTASDSWTPTDGNREKESPST